MSNLYPNSSNRESAVITPPPDIFSPLVNAYEERGYEAGYARGVSDALAFVLEATAEFSRLRRESAAETRKLLYEFSTFIEKQLQGASGRAEAGFSGGLGI